MLFNSFEFIFVFLPITLAVYFLLGFRGKYLATQAWVVAASLIFYSWHHLGDLGILLPSILLNFFLGAEIARRRAAKSLLIVGITGNLLLLAYFKYSKFIALNLAATTPIHIAANMLPDRLPLGISFFTFLQIAYLVDSYRRITKDYDLVRYSAFVSFFPHLIAGPILHHAKIIPQLDDHRTYRLDKRKWQMGLTFFVIGLFKKVIVADTLSPFSGAFFSGDASQLSMFGAWVGALSYTFQLYFDFSGYSDMAIGLGFLFGIEMPENFLSPYKSKSITEFWRRWHITLSAFLREYLYIPLGGNRRGAIRQICNLMITMTLAGLWHGAGWGFVVWGGFHGVLLVANHLFDKCKKRLVWLGCEFSGRPVLAWTATFLAVVVGWVFFRSPTLSYADTMLEVMFGFHGFSIPPDLYSQITRSEGMLAGLVRALGVSSTSLMQYPDKEIFLVGLPMIVLALAASLILPNAFEIVRWLCGKRNDGMVRFDAYATAVSCAVAVTGYLAISLIGQPSEFLYFQF